MSIIGDHMSKVLGLGTVLRMDDRAAAFRQIFPDATMPPKRWETNVATYLYNRRYHTASIRLVLDHAAEVGSVECSAELVFDDTDRAHVEAMLPDCPAGDWGRFPGRYELSTPGCEV